MPSTSPIEPPLVSVIMPAHNAALYLAEAIESVLAQTWEKMELIMVDDASTDKTEEIIRQYMKKDRRVRYLENKFQSGQSASRNRAIREARGKYVMIVDSDDICLPARFAVQVAYMEKNPEIGILGTDWRYFTKDDQSDGVLASCPDDSLRRALPPVNNPTCCIRREIFDRYGYYDSRFDNAEDTELWFRWHAQGVRFANLHQVLYHKRTHASNVSVLRLRSQIGLMLRILVRSILRDRVRFSAVGYRRIGETAAYYLYLSLRLDRLRKRIAAP